MDFLPRPDAPPSVGAPQPAQPPLALYRPGVPFRSLVEAAERYIVERALAHHRGQMAATARDLELERSYLYKKCRALGLRTGKDERDEKP